MTQPQLLAMVSRRFFMEKYNVTEMRNRVDELEKELSLARKLLDDRTQLVAEMQDYLNANGETDE